MDCVRSLTQKLADEHLKMYAYEILRSGLTNSDLWIKNRAWERQAHLVLQGDAGSESFDSVAYGPAREKFSHALGTDRWLYLGAFSTKARSIIGFHMRSSFPNDSWDFQDDLPTRSRSDDILRGFDTLLIIPDAELIFACKAEYADFLLQVMGHFSIDSIGYHLVRPKANHPLDKLRVPRTWALQFLEDVGDEDGRLFVELGNEIWTGV